MLVPHKDTHTQMSMPMQTQFVRLALPAMQKRCSKPSAMACICRATSCLAYWTCACILRCTGFLNKLHPWMQL